MAQQTRKDPRAKVLSMTVRYKSATLDEFIEHHSHDVSRGGMFIKTPQPFPPGTLLKFEVRIAEDRKVMQGVGRVVWKRDLSAADAERPAGMGVKFIKLDDDSRRLIDQLLSTRRDEVSAFDSEGSQPGVDTEVPVGLGTDPLSMPAPRSSPEEPSFFPKGKPAELPPPEDRTVMKQAAELLEEAMREVSSDVPAAAKPLPLSPAGTDEKEDTKPGRPSKTGDSMGRLPAPKMPPLKEDSDASGSSARAPVAQRVEGAAGTVKAAAGINAEQAGKAGAATRQTSPPDLASAAKGITDQARALSTSKAPASASAKPTSASSSATKGEAAISKSAPAASKSAAAQPSAPEPARGSSRVVFWFLAVAVCATATWWIWRQPPADLPSSDAPAPQLEQPAKPAENAVATAAAVESATAVVDAAVIEPPAASAAASVNAAPEPASELPVATAAPVVAVPTPVAKVVAPTVARAATKPKAVTPTTTEAPAVAAEPAPAATPEAAPAKEAPVEAKPVAPEPAATAAPAEAPIAPFPPRGTKKSKKPAVETDNPY